MQLIPHEQERLLLSYAPDLAGRRQGRELGPGGAGWAPPLTPRAYATELVLDGSTVDAATGGHSVRLPLPDGWTATAWADDLDAAVLPTGGAG